MYYFLKSRLAEYFPVLISRMTNDEKLGNSPMLAECCPWVRGPDSVESLFPELRLFSSSQAGFLMIHKGITLGSC